MIYLDATASVVAQRNMLKYQWLAKTKNVAMMFYHSDSPKISEMYISSKTANKRYLISRDVDYHDNIMSSCSVVSTLRPKTSFSDFVRKTKRFISRSEFNVDLNTQCLHANK